MAEVYDPGRNPVQHPLQYFFHISGDALYDIRTCEQARLWRIVFEFKPPASARGGHFPTPMAVTRNT
jgi:hypothetical protein